MYTKKADPAHQVGFWFSSFRANFFKICDDPYNLWLNP